MDTVTFGLTGSISALRRIFRANPVRGSFGNFSNGILCPWLSAGTVHRLTNTV
jgi:hypothetical protein